VLDAALAALDPNARADLVRRLWDGFSIRVEPSGTAGSTLFPEEVEVRVSAQPGWAAAADAGTGDAYNALGKWDEAIAHYRRALDIREDAGVYQKLGLAQALLGRPRLLVLDEPELGLHPHAIAALAELVKTASRKTQVLLATQSETLLNHFSPEEIVVVERQGRESVFKRLKTNELEEWLSRYAMSELWEKNVLGGRP
jgi:tetratricopeptide (TPR) repeat protein